MQEAPEKAAGPLFRIVEVCRARAGQPRFAGPHFAGPLAREAERMPVFIFSPLKT